VTVTKAGSRRSISTACGAVSPKKPAAPAGRKTVSTGCGTSTGWAPKPAGKKTTKVSEASQRLLDKAGGSKRRTTTSTACGTSTPSKPAPKPTTPAKPSKPTRTGC
jgi:hypothetical protein